MIKKLLERFTRVAELQGMSKSETFRKALEMFIETSTGGKTITSRMRGIVKSKLTPRKLEEAYLVSK